MGSFFVKGQPLGLPKGSVRAVLALVVVVPVAVISLKSGVQFTGDQVIGLVSLVLLAYFNKSTPADGQ